MTYKVIKPLRHNHERFGPGDAAPEMPAEELRRLIDLGVVELEVIAVSPAPEAEAEKPTKKELLARAEELGISIKGRATNEEIAAAIEAVEIATTDDVGGDGLPEGVAPELQE